MQRALSLRKTWTGYAANSPECFMRALFFRSIWQLLILNGLNKCLSKNTKTLLKYSQQLIQQFIRNIFALFSHQVWRYLNIYIFTIYKYFEKYIYKFLTNKNKKYKNCICTTKCIPKFKHCQINYLSKRILYIA